MKLYKLFKLVYFQRIHGRISYKIVYYLDNYLELPISCQKESTLLPSHHVALTSHPYCWRSQMYLALVCTHYKDTG